MELVPELSGWVLMERMEVSELDVLEVDDEDDVSQWMECLGASLICIMSYGPSLLLFCGRALLDLGWGVDPSHW